MPFGLSPDADRSEMEARRSHSSRVFTYNRIFIRRITVCLWPLELCWNQSLHLTNSDGHKEFLAMESHPDGGSSISFDRYDSRGDKARRRMLSFSPRTSSLRIHGWSQCTSPHAHQNGSAQRNSQLSKINVVCFDTSYL